MLDFLSICLGGAAGTGARYLLASWLAKAAPAVFPVATLAVNVIGSFCLALLLAVFAHAPGVPATVRLTLTVGVLGGFTTFSAFSCETFACLQQGHLWTAASYVAASVFGCLLACVLGHLAGNWLAA